MTGSTRPTTRWKQLESNIQTPTAGRKEAGPDTVKRLPAPSFHGAEGPILEQGSTSHVQRLKIFRDKSTIHNKK